MSVFSWEFAGLRVSQNVRVPSARFADQLHEAFLERASTLKGSESGRSAFGGFLVMRLIDQLGASRAAPSSFSYQLKATSSFIQDLYPPTVEVNHLRELVRVAAAVRKTAHNAMLLAPLIAYARWLEEQMFFADAIDVLDTAVSFASKSESVALHLQRARALRMSGRLDDARRAYEFAGELAKKQDDSHSEMLSRIGYAIVLQKVGNLPASERLLRDVLDDARRAGDQEAEARASHDLAIALHFGGRTRDGVPLAFRAYQLYTVQDDRARALGDTGLLFKGLGLLSAARHAYSLVVSGNPPPEVRVRALVELLEISALDGDRLSFERLRRELQASAIELPPDEQVNYEIQIGYGLSLFGRHQQAEGHLTRAIQLAEQFNLGERLFHAEGLLEHVRKRRSPPRGQEATPPKVGVASYEPEVQDTIERLETLQTL